jgi:hypothetical protein
VIDVTYKNESGLMNCSYTYSIIHTWTATDSSGNTQTVKATVKIFDDDAPEQHNIPADTTVECEQIPDRPEINATDNCDDEVLTSFSSYRINTSIVHGYLLVREWESQDSCGNSVTDDQTITVIDTTPPTLIDVPDDVVVDCDSLPPPEMVHADDNCDDVQAILTFTEINGTCAGTKKLVRTWTATDLTGNTVTESQTVSFTDSNAPSFIFEFDIDPVEYPECDDIPDPPLVTAHDDCSGNVTVVDTNSTVDIVNEDNYKIIRTWYAEDDCGHFARFVQTLVVQDTTPPEFDIPGDTTADCDDVPDEASVIGEDNCDEALSVIYTETKIEGTCEHSYTLVRTWSATDLSGNFLTKDQTIVVTDTDLPSIDVQGGSQIIAECDDIPPSNASSSDDCDKSVHVEESPEVKIDGSSPYDYKLVRTFTATDRCGNQASAAQTVIVEDTTPPYFTDIPDDESVAIQHVPGAYSAQANDNCSETTIYYTESRENLTCLHNFQLLRYWEATDESGNIAFGYQTITVSDWEPPVIHNVPDDVTFENIDTIPDPPADVYATDNSGGLIDVIVSEDKVPGNSDTEFVVTRTFYAEDACGNIADEQQVITVIDTIPPELTCLPEDRWVECDAIPDVPQVSVLYEDELVVNFTQSVLNRETDQDQDYIIRRFWTAQDAATNIFEHEQSIHVADSTAPKFSRLPPDLSVSCDCDTFPVAVNLTAVDNCDETHPEVSLVQTLHSQTNEDNYVQIRTWTAIDASGNVATHSQTVTVTDDSPPEFVTPYVYSWEENVDAHCDEVPPPAIVRVRDNCDEDISSKLVETFIPGSCNQNYQIVHTWTSTDRSGNSAILVQTISVSDSSNPQYYPSTLTNCLFPPNNDYVAFHVSNLFEVSDSCSQIVTELLHCNSTQPDTQSVDGVNFEDGFGLDCDYDSTTGTLYLKAERLPDVSVGRTYTVRARVSDVCGNSIEVDRHFWVPVSGDDLNGNEVCTSPSVTLDQWLSIRSQ